MHRVLLGMGLVVAGCSSANTPAVDGNDLGQATQAMVDLGAPSDLAHGRDLSSTPDLSTVGTVVGPTWDGQTYPGQSMYDDLQAVWASGANDAYFSMGALIFHFDGSTWRQAPQRAPGKIRRIFGTGANDVYAVGEGQTLFHSTGDGNWTAETAPSDANCDSLYGVWASGPNDVYVVGFSEGFSGCVLHRDASGWTLQAEDKTAAGLELGWLRAVWGSGPGDIYAVGDSGIRHSTGAGDWVAQSSPSGVMGLSGVWGSSSSDVYAVGSYASLNGPNGNYIIHSAGDGNWTTQALPPVQLLFAISGSGPNDIRAVGNQGVIVHSTGGGVWVDDSSPYISTDALWDVFAAAPNDWWVVGLGGALYRYH